MYNYKQYLQKEKIKGKQQRIKTNENQIQNHRKQRQKELLIQHNIRIQNSILHLIQTPKHINTYQSPSYKPREEDITKRIAHGFMAFNYDDEATRIEKAKKRHEQLDLTPLQKISSVRNSYQVENNREDSKENRKRKINKSLYHSAINTNQNRSFNEFYFPMVQNLQKDEKLYLHTYKTVINMPKLGLKGPKQFYCSNSMAALMRGERQLLEGLKQTNVKNEIDYRKNQIIQNCKVALKKCGLMPSKYNNKFYSMAKAK